MDIGMETARWIILLIICLGFIVLGKKVCNQKRQILELQQEIQGLDFDLQVVVSRIVDVIKWNNLKNFEK